MHIANYPTKHSEVLYKIIGLLQLHHKLSSSQFPPPESRVMANVCAFWEEISLTAERTRYLIAFRAKASFLHVSFIAGVLEDLPGPHLTTIACRPLMVEYL